MYLNQRLDIGRAHTREAFVEPDEKLRALVIPDKPLEIGLIAPVQQLGREPFDKPAKAGIFPQGMLGLARHIDQTRLIIGIDAILLHQQDAVQQAAGKGISVEHTQLPIAHAVFVPAWRTLGFEHIHQHGMGRFADMGFHQRNMRQGIDDIALVVHARPGDGLPRRGGYRRVEGLRRQHAQGKQAASMTVTQAFAQRLGSGQVPFGQRLLKPLRVGPGHAEESGSGMG